MQDIKYCSVDWRPSTNTSVNNVISYIETSCNYTEAFGLLRLTMLTCTGLQEPHEVYQLLYRVPLTTWGFLTANNKRVPFRYSVHPYHNPHWLLLFLKNEKKVHNTLIMLTSICGWLFLDPVTSNCKFYGCWKGVCRICFKLNFSKEKAYLKLSTSETYCI